MHSKYSVPDRRKCFSEPWLFSIISEVILLMFLSQLFQCYALRPQQPSWGIPRAQCFVLPSGPYGWASVWCLQPCLLPWPTTWICGRPTRPWLATPWTRSLWISCCPPASTSRWTSRERPQSSTSSWWVLLCIIKTTSPIHRHYLMAVLTGWLLWLGGNFFFFFVWVHLLALGQQTTDDVITSVAKAVHKTHLLLKKTLSFSFHNDVVSFHMTSNIHWLHLIGCIKQTKAPSLCAEVPSARPWWRQAISDTLAQPCGRMKRLVFPKHDTRFYQRQFHKDVKTNLCFPLTVNVSSVSQSSMCFTYSMSQTD